MYDLMICVRYCKYTREYCQLHSNCVSRLPIQYERCRMEASTSTIVIQVVISCPFICFSVVRMNVYLVDQATQDSRIWLKNGLIPRYFP